jgi:ubiquinone/menaquinone biosynthesis C-methylase UbiE
MFGDSTVAEIYSSHSFHYFDYFEADEVLREWKRILRRNGVLRLSVPDFDALVRIYSLSQKSIATIMGPLFGRWPTDGGNYIYAKTTYNLESLREKLEIAGFSDIETYSSPRFLESIDPNYDDHSLSYFPHMDREGIQVSLNLVARKK